MNAAPGDRRRFVDTAEAAALMGLSARTLECWRVRGGGPSFVRMMPATGVACRAVRYQLADLDAWIEARKVTR